MRAWVRPILLLLLPACSTQSAPRDVEHPDARVGAVALPSAPSAPASGQDDRHTVGSDASPRAANMDAGSVALDPVDALPPADAMLAADALPAQFDATPADATLDAQQREDASRPPHSATAVYSAERFVGETDRVTITKRDPGKAHCLMLITAFPARDVEPSDVALPAMWLTRFYALAIGPDGRCILGSDASPEWQVSKKATGRLAWRALGAHGQPCSVDLDIEVSFTPTARIPARDDFLVENLPIPCD